MATAYENLVKHLKSAIRQLEQLTSKISSVDEDELLDLVDRIDAIIPDLDRFRMLGIPGFMKGPEIVAALRPQPG